jgi:hypothetical protein
MTARIAIRFNRALHMIAIPVGFSSVIVVWSHWIICAAAHPDGLCAGLTGPPDRGQQARVSDQSCSRVCGAGVDGAEDLGDGAEEDRVVTVRSPSQPVGTRISSITACRA